MYTHRQTRSPGAHVHARSLNLHNTLEFKQNSHTRHCIIDLQHLQTPEGQHQVCLQTDSMEGTSQHGSGAVSCYVQLTRFYFCKLTRDKLFSRVSLMQKPCCVFKGCIRLALWLASSVEEWGLHSWSFPKSSDRSFCAAETLNVDVLYLKLCF